MKAETLVSAVNTVYQKRGKYVAAMEKSPQSNAVQKVIDLIEGVVG